MQLLLIYRYMKNHCFTIKYFVTKNQIDMFSTLEKYSTEEKVAKSDMHKCILILKNVIMFSNKN